MFQDQDEPLTTEEFQHIAALARRVEYLEAQGQHRDGNRRREIEAIRWVFTDLLGMTPPASPEARSTPEVQVYQRVDRGGR